MQLRRGFRHSSVSLPDAWCSTFCLGRCTATCTSWSLSAATFTTPRPSRLCKFSFFALVWRGCCDRPAWGLNTTAYGTSSIIIVARANLFWREEHTQHCNTHTHTARSLAVVFCVGKSPIYCWFNCC